MKSKIYWILPASLVVVVCAGASYKCIQKKNDKRGATVQLLVESLEAGHYKPQVIDDAFSEKVFDLYLKRLDYNKKFFLQEDIRKLAKFKDDLDDEAQKGEYAFLDETNTIFSQRLDEAEKICKEILEKPFEFTAEENIETEPKKLTYAANEAELKENWRKALKYQVLTRVADMLETQEKAAEKKDTSVKVRSMQALEADARQKIAKANEDVFKRYHKLDQNDRLELYLNSITNVFDPHTEFFLPKDKENFDISMTGQLEGIGAQLQEKDGNIRVANIVVGSASWREGRLKAGDIIMKVAQGKEEPIDIAGMRIDDVVKLVRGKKGTEVRLTVKKPDASMVVIAIIRDIVVLEETYAKSAILETDKKIGYIKLPIFYSPMSGNGKRFCSIDVKNELLKLEKEHVSGVILDLRYNGGGSLQDVVDMAGLFIDKGPIVQVKSRTGQPNLLEDRDPAVVYDGPLVVMVNYGSASASEIMAAAMQDYKRGVIVGTRKTFGKGTVQRFIDLDNFLSPAAPSDLKPLGSVKLTTQKFYRINGGATQLKGVTPDVILPDSYELLDQGEKEQDFPMPWDEIAKASYTPWHNGTLNTAQVSKSSEERVKKSEVFTLVAEEAQKLKKQSDKTLISLNMDRYRAEDKRSRDNTKKVEAVEKEITNLKVVNLPDDIKEMEADTVKKSRNTEWLKNIRKDYQLYEAISVVKEIK